MKNRKIPLRKCIGCGEMIGKKGLLRVVRNKEGEFALDLTGKLAGRGAYICNDLECFQKARKTKAFERSFKSAIPEAVYDSLEKAVAENAGNVDE